MSPRRFLVLAFLLLLAVALLDSYPRLGGRSQVVVTATPEARATSPAFFQPAAATDPQELKPPKQLLATGDLSAPAPPAAPVPSAPPPPRARLQPRLPSVNYPTARSRTAPPPAEVAVTAPPEALQPQREADDVEQAQQASASLDQSVRSGRLLAEFQGTGQLTQMASVDFVNTGKRPVHLLLVPGMILQPPGNQKVQPLLVEENLDVMLAPGQVYSTDLHSFCMDSQKPAPLAGQSTDYHFQSQLDARQRLAAHLLQVSQQVELHPLLAPDLHRRLVVQVAVWSALGQPQPKLWLDHVLAGPQLEAMTGGHHLAEVKAGIEADAQLILRSAR